MSKCEKCKHCVITIGGYDGSRFLECKLQREQARKATSGIYKASRKADMHIRARKTC